MSRRNPWLKKFHPPTRYRKRRIPWPAPPRSRLTTPRRGLPRPPPRLLRPSGSLKIARARLRISARGGRCTRSARRSPNPRPRLSRSRLTWGMTSTGSCPPRGSRVPSRDTCTRRTTAGWGITSTNQNRNSQPPRHRRTQRRCLRRSRGRRCRTCC